MGVEKELTPAAFTEPCYYSNIESDNIYQVSGNLILDTAESIEPDDYIIIDLITINGGFSRIGSTCIKVDGLGDYSYTLSYFGGTIGDVVVGDPSYTYLLSTAYTKKVDGTYERQSKLDGALEMTFTNPPTDLIGNDLTISDLG